MGVTILHGKMFLIFEISCVVRVYYIDDFEMQLDEIHIPDMQFPHDIVACDITEKIFVADMQRSEAGCVWRLSSSGDFDVYLPSSQEPEGLWPRSLAAAYGYLLVVSKSHPNVLLMYGVGCHRVCKVKLPPDMDVEHAVATRHKTFIVCLFTAEITLYLLREVDLNGNTVRICPVGFNLPAHLAVDPAGRILVADRYDNRVVLLDEYLHFKRVLLAGDLREPRRLLLQPDLGQLYVCEMKKGSLWVVGVQSPNSSISYY